MAVPVVSATLTTRTEPCPDGMGKPKHHRSPIAGKWWECSTCDGKGERLTADPVFVPLPEAPDLTCRTCGGDGRRNLELHDMVGDPCLSCGGSGVLPVYAATWQCRMDSQEPWDEQCVVADDDWWRTQPQFHERRQVVEWRATDVTVLPVEPGQFVLRLDGWERLEQPCTTMRVGLSFVDQRTDTSTPGGHCDVPLSVPDGVLSWIELA